MYLNGDVSLLVLYFVDTLLEDVVGKKVKVINSNASNALSCVAIVFVLFVFVTYVYVCRMDWKPMLKSLIKSKKQLRIRVRTL